MNLTITGKNIQVTDGIKSALADKFAKLNSYFNRDDVSARVVVSAHQLDKKLEVTIFTPQMIFRAEAADADLYNAMDKALEKLEGQMRKLKTRLDRRKKRESIAESINFENIESERIDEELDKIIRTKSIYLEPMTVEDAIARMEAIDHPFFLYLDIDEDRISVVYRRYEGGYGVLEAENQIK